MLGRPIFLALLLACTVSCIDSAPLPGELLGQFTLTAKQDGPAFTDCAVGEIPDGGFVFDTALRWDPDGGAAWMVVGGVAREATYDGAVLRSTASGQQAFAACTCAQVLVEETVTVALLSQSQAAAVGPGCPAEALDGGIPQPDDDAGIRGPGPTDAGYDAVRACGTLVEVLKPATGCTCASCTIRYRVEGDRR